MLTLTAEPLVEPDLEPVDGEDEPDHLFCCDRDRALCGWPIPDDGGWWESDDEPDADLLCGWCADLDGKPCGPKCPLRPRWRRWFR